LKKSPVARPGFFIGVRDEAKLIRHRPGVRRDDEGFALDEWDHKVRSV
jgi:hypothetical protein